MHLTYRKTCRICGSSALTKVIDLGQQHLQGSFIKEGRENPPLRRIATELVRCNPTVAENTCGLLQMAASVPPEVLYSSYWYRSGTNHTMREHLNEIAATNADLAGKEKAVVLDIGCNDGTLLNYYPGNFVKYGIDPSDITKETAGNIRIVQDTFPSAELEGMLAGTTVDIVTSIAMFYDIEDPISFVKNVKNILSSDGLWVFEMSYMPAMLQMNSYDTICHEHLEYYSFAVIEYLMARCGLKVFKVDFNNINGGSIRCYATHTSNFKFKSHEFQQTLKRVRQQEFDLELDTDKPYKDFQDRINSHKEELSSLLKRLKIDGRCVHVYGASTKGNTILQWCGIDNTIIDYASDRNPDKSGARTIGTNIPIISEEESRRMKPDYYLVLPWHFRDEFLEREKEIINNGTKFIFPLPEIEIVGKQRHPQTSEMLYESLQRV